MIECDPLDTLLAGLDCSIIDGRVWLDGPSPVAQMATAPLRGLSGWLVLERFPSLAAACFKPGQDGNQPPAYVFQLQSPVAARVAGFDFRCVTWDRGRRLADALCAVWPEAAGRPFGQGTVRVKSVEVSRRRDGVLKTLKPAPVIDRCLLGLVTPVLLKNGAKGWLGPGDLTLPHLLRAIARRLGTLSLCYGNGQQLDEIDTAVRAADVAVTKAALNWSSPERKSATQGTAIKLSGVMGYYHLDRVPLALAELLAAATLFHVGKHACEGCGRLKVREAGDGKS